MKVIRCEVCQAILGEKTKNGILIKKENHKSILIPNVLEIMCENNHKNYVNMVTSGENIKQ